MTLHENHDKRPLRIVTMGGGSGQHTLLRSLREMAGVEITAIVSMVDSGGSTGRLRNELGILPPGDILKCLLALSPEHKSVHRLLRKRFESDPRLAGHSSGNMLLTMLSRYTGSFQAGVKALAEILGTKGEVLPVTTDQATLVAELTDGTRVFGEKAIDLPWQRQREMIRDVFLVPHHGDRVQPHPPVLSALETAEYVILGPGDLFTSTIPNLLVPKVAQALNRSGAALVYITNIMTKFGETHQFRASDFIHRLEAFTRRPVDIVLYNDRQPEKALRDRYAEQNAEFVEADFDAEFKAQRHVYVQDLLASSAKTVGHDAAKLSRALVKVFSGGRSR